MFIVGLNGSPNKEGNTSFLLRYILNETNKNGCEYEIINIAEALNSAKTPFCNACSTPCSGKCYGGTPLEEAFNLISKADAVILGTPVYFGTVSAQIKAFFDKTRKIRGEKVWINKIAAGVTVGASKYGGQETAIRALHDILLVHGMVIVGDGHPEYGAGHHGVCAQKPAKEDEDALNRAKVLAEEIVYMVKNNMIK
ncbi:MAG: flavodoxin family protein [Ignavibacteriales bacterium]